ncbi:hypothetical protein ACFY12_28385 [Streptomyces sp. NPDC001339]|uniref:hypothetical protein n=1 Tax=Streptomyces sp. NPDC001339 TaxID=3364563 RepID=UPI0036C2CDE5
MLRAPCRRAREHGSIDRDDHPRAGLPLSLVPLFSSSLVPLFVLLLVPLFLVLVQRRLVSGLDGAVKD